MYNQAAPFLDGIPEYRCIGLIRTRELSDTLQQLGDDIAVMMRSHGITTALPDMRAAKTAGRIDIGRGKCVVRGYTTVFYRCKTGRDGKIVVKDRCWA